MQYSYKEIDKIKQKYNFNFKKKLGQNFIIDENIIKSIITKSKIDEESLVVEIGPGSGSLTSKLSEKAKNVLCYEIDITLKPILEDNLKEYNNIEIIYQDFLKTDLKQHLKNYKYKNLYLIANLPYYITTPIITKIIEDDIDIDKIIIMVQKEVGDRFKAKPNTKDYNSLSIFLQYNFDIKKIMDVSKNVFIPKPNVDSIVIELIKKEKKQLKNKELFYKLIKDSFSQKRKTLKNNLKNYDLTKIEQILNRHNLTLNVRAEQIDIDKFIDIANNL